MSELIVYAPKEKISTEEIAKLLVEDAKKRLKE